MDNNKKDERMIGDTDRSENDGVESSSAAAGRSDLGLTERLTDILVEDGDGDLLIENNSREGEDRVMQWLQALDMQVMGACRADERLKPLLKLNVSNGVAEDRLLSQLSQHFEPSEVAMLARCLCIPLVSIRVGKINKQGTLLCPTSTRGNLTLTLLPTSNLRISFIGDDGHMERLSTLSSTSSSSVEIEEISADKSGRSFVMRIVGCEHLYFWCSEKSKLLGEELLDKLKDLLQRKPSLSELTGISESRLGCFATHLRSYLGGSTTVTKAQTSPVILANLPLDILDAHLSSASSKPSRPRSYGSQGGRPNPVYQASLSPRSSSFKEGLQRNLSTLKNVSREKFRRRGDSHLSFIDNLSVASPSNADGIDVNQSKPKLPEFDGNLMSPLSPDINSLMKSMNPLSVSMSATQGLPGGSSHMSPYYCWCPPVASTLQYAVAPLHLPISSTESFSLPPLSSLLSTSMPSSLLVEPPNTSPLNISEIPSLDFPPFLPEPLVRLPLSMPTSQQIATFTPLMCDPIVHVPCIDICSSGPGYFVSAGPSLSTTVSTLHPTLVNPLNPTSDPMMMENNARETLRLLLSSSNQNDSQLMSVLPSVLTNSAENRSILATTGTRGLYEGIGDVGAITTSIAAMGLVSLSERSMGSTGLDRCLSQTEMVDQLEKRGGSSGTCLDDESPSFSNLGDE